MFWVAGPVVFVCTWIHCFWRRMIGTPVLVVMSLHHRWLCVLRMSGSIVFGPDDDPNYAVYTDWYVWAFVTPSGSESHQSSCIRRCLGRVDDHHFQFQWWNESCCGDCLGDSRNPVVCHGRGARSRKYRQRICTNRLVSMEPVPKLFFQILPCKNWQSQAIVVSPWLHRPFVHSRHP